jgi:predicted RNase H-like HicB family nuclease
MSHDDALRLYRTLPYRRELERVIDDEDGTFYICRYPELPGVVADGATAAEARRLADMAFDNYILAQIEWGFSIPKPPGAERVEEAQRQLDAARAAMSTKEVEPLPATSISAPARGELLPASPLKDTPKTLASGSWFDDVPTKSIRFERVPA